MKDKKLPPDEKDGPICTICNGGHRAAKCPDRPGKRTTGRKSKGKQW